MEKIDVRPLAAADRDCILEFSRELFDGWDYVEHIFDTWLENDERNLTLVGERGGNVIALLRLAQLSPGEWWIEGLRADRKLPPNIIAAVIIALRRAVIDFLKTREVKTFRYSTLLTNTRSRRIAKMFGFRETDTVPHFLGPLEPENPAPETGLVIERPDGTGSDHVELARTIQRLGGHTCFHLWWVDREIAADFIRELCENGRLWVGKNGGKVVSAAAMINYDWMNFQAASFCGKSAVVTAPLVTRMATDLAITDERRIGMSFTNESIAEEMRSLFAPQAELKRGVLMELTPEIITRYLR